jgi:predicted amidophosphoribosyltransferase
MFDSLRDLIFTPTCIGCNAPGVHVCRECLASITPQAVADQPNLERVISASLYGGWVRDSLIAYKNGSRRHVYGLARVLHRAVHACGDLGPVTVVPMPSNPVKVAMRGFDTIDLLVTECMKLQPRPQAAHSRVLYVHRQVADQVGLSANERQHNVANSMAARFPITGTALLVDDVVTTGSTMQEAARALHIAGARRVFGISLCGSTKWG